MSCLPCYLWSQRFQIKLNQIFFIVHLTAVNSMKGIKARVGENRMLVILR